MLMGVNIRTKAKNKALVPAGPDAEPEEIKTSG